MNSFILKTAIFDPRVYCCVKLDSYHSQGLMGIILVTLMCDLGVIL